MAKLDQIYEMQIRAQGGYAGSTATTGGHPQGASSSGDTRAQGRGDGGSSSGGGGGRDDGQSSGCRNIL